MESSTSSPTSPSSSSCSPEYLIQLLKDKRQLQVLPACFIHLERLLDDEINRVRSHVLHLGIDSEPLQLPEPVGPVVTLQEKLTVPVKDHPDFNFVGRLLGPRGMTAKQLEMETGCKILIRGRGSMRDKHKEELMRGKAKWEHLNEDLHVLVTVEDTKNRAGLKLKRAAEEVKKLLVPSPESEDELKKRQLMELALINGTYRGFQNNNNNNNNLSNGNGIGVLMMTSGSPFCPAGLPAGMMPPRSLPIGHHPPGTQLIVMSDHAGAPIFLAGPPPMLSPCPGSVPSLTSPGMSPPPMITSEMCKLQSMPMSGMPPPSQGGIYYHHFDPSVGTSSAIPISVSSPLFEFPMTSLAGNDMCHTSNITMASSYVH